MDNINLSEYVEWKLLLKDHQDPYIVVDNNNRWYMRFQLLYSHNREAIIELLTNNYWYTQDDVHIIQDEEGSLLMIENLAWGIETKKIEEIYKKILHDVLGSQ